MKCSKKVREMISDWLEGSGYKFNDFETLLKYAKLDNEEKIEDVVLDDVKELRYVSDNCLECKTIYQKYSVLLNFTYGDGCDEGNHLVVSFETSEKTIQKTYHLLGVNSGLSPLLLYTTRIIIGNVSLISWNYEDEYTRALNFGNYRFELRVKNKDENKIRTVKNDGKLDKYLFSLREDLDIEVVYNKILEHFSSMDDGYLCLRKKFYEKYEAISEIKLEDGKIISYAKKIENTTFRVHDSGNWEYLNYEFGYLVKLSYKKKFDSYLIESKNSLEFSIKDLKFNVSKIQELFETALGIKNQ